LFIQSAEHDKRRPPFCDDDDNEPEATDEENFDASKVTPVFFGCIVNQVPVDDLAIGDFNPAVSHPALFGYQLVSKPEPPPPASPPNKYSCKIYDRWFCTLSLLMIYCVRICGNI